MAIEMPLSPTQQIDAIRENWKIPRRGNMAAPIVVLCEAPDVQTARQGLPMSMELLKQFAKLAKINGLVQNDFLFIGLCPPIPVNMTSSDSKQWGFVQDYQAGVWEALNTLDPEFVITLGKMPARVLSGRSMAINKARGQFYEAKAPNDKEPDRWAGKFFAMLSAKLVGMQPDYVPIMAADMHTISRVKSASWDTTILAKNEGTYEWCFDLQPLIDSDTKVLSIDTETTGLDTGAEDFKVICAQITYKEGHTLVVRLTPDYQPAHPIFAHQTEADIIRLRGQLKQLLENRKITKILHNGKYDFKALRTIGIEMTDWWDTELMCRFLNENFMQYSLDEMVRIYVPDMAGYADGFNASIDKSRMIDLPPIDEFDDSGTLIQHGMLTYAGGDTDATFRLGKSISAQLKQDPQNLHVMNRVHKRGLFAFAKTMETYGFSIDEDELGRFQQELGVWINDETNALMRLTPAAVRRKWLSNPKGFRISDDNVMRDIFFRPMDQSKRSLGFGLKPVVFTKGTAEELDPTKRVPSISIKDHLPYFVGEAGNVGEYVTRYIALKQAIKMYDTYAKGFWKYIQDGYGGERKIIPHYNFRTNTKRSNSQNPNGQNFPKRGRFAKPFRRLFKASRGKVLVASDLSQAELRVAAVMANERAMLQIYLDDGDIHTSTAAMVMGMTVDEFAALDPKTRKTKRQGAKAVNFGLIYGAREQTFITYAKTTYGVDYTMAEARHIRQVYFTTYAGLLAWHEKMKTHAKQHGFVRSLHGLTRHLHSIASTDWSVQSGAERNAINSPVQNFGSDLGIMAFTRLASQADPRLIRPVGFIHDQLIAEVDSGYVAEGMGWLKWVMESQRLTEEFGLNFPIPIRSDPEWGDNLADTTELADDPEMTARVMPHVRKPDWWEDDEEAAWIRYVETNDVPDYVVREVLRNQ